MVMFDLVLCVRQDLHLQPSSSLRSTLYCWSYARVAGRSVALLPVGDDSGRLQPLREEGELGLVVDHQRDRARVVRQRARARGARGVDQLRCERPEWKITADDADVRERGLSGKVERS